MDDTEDTPEDLKNTSETAEEQAGRELVSKRMRKRWGNQSLEDFRERIRETKKSRDAALKKGQKRQIELCQWVYEQTLFAIESGGMARLLEVYKEQGLNIRR